MTTTRITEASLTVPLFAHQREGLTFPLEHPRSMLGDFPGAGKRLTASAVVAARRAVGGQAKFRDHRLRVNLQRSAKEEGLTMPTRTGWEVDLGPLYGAQGAAHDRDGQQCGLCGFQRRQKPGRLAPDRIWAFVDTAATYRAPLLETDKAIWTISRNEMTS